MEEEQIIQLQGTQEELMRLIPQLLIVHQLFKQNNDKGLYSLPVTTFQDNYTYTPQIKLVFYQLREETKNNLPRVTGDITYRIIGETAESFTPANAKIRAKRIKALFTEPEIFIWQKGKEIVSYLDKKNGYDFRLYVKSEAEGRKIISQVMLIENKIPDWDNLRISTSGQNFPEITGSKRIYGEQRRLARRRPTEDIKFRYAELHLWGVPKPITLIDTLGNRNEPIIKPFD